MIGDRIDIAAAYLRAGNVVAIPTETVYGLACNALNISAITKVYSVKERPYFDPLIVHVGSIEDIVKYAYLDDPMLVKIAKDQMPGPLTLLLKKRSIIPDLITAGSERVAIRIPSHPMSRELLDELEFPLAAPSANPFGYISPTKAEHVDKQLGSKIPYILNGGPCSVGLESTIIGVEDSRLTVYRKGGLSVETLIDYEGNINILESSSSNPKSPGMLKSHYAPETSLIIVEDIEEKVKKAIEKGLRVGALTYGAFQIECDMHLMLSESSELDVAAGRLFEYMRRLDEAGLDVIYTSLVPEEGLGLAINDRLRRATA